MYLTSASTSDSGETTVRLRAQRLQPVQHAQRIRDWLPMSRVSMDVSMLDGNTEVCVVLPSFSSAAALVHSDAQTKGVHWLRGASNVLLFASLTAWLMSLRCLREPIVSMIVNTSLACSEADDIHKSTHTQFGWVDMCGILNHMRGNASALQTVAFPFWPPTFLR